LSVACLQLRGDEDERASVNGQELVDPAGFRESTVDRRLRRFGES
jgi:hypothetical protein